jgi:GT2 family glycosyltransferase
VKVSAVVVSHGHASELARSLPALIPKVDETLVVANVPASVSSVSSGIRVLENPRPLPLAANVNLGIAATTGEYVLNVNPDAMAEPEAVSALVAFADAPLGLEWLFVRKRKRTVACQAHRLRKMLRACPRFQTGL